MHEHIEDENVAARPPSIAPMRTLMSRHVGIAMMVICWFAWGFSYPATKIALETHNSVIICST